MPNPRLAARYAKSLIHLAIEKEQLENVYADMQWLQAVCKSSRDFVNVLRSPVIDANTKKKILGKVTEGHLGELTTAFYRLLITKGREPFLPEIVTAFISAYKEYKNIQVITLTTATHISDRVKQSIVDRVKQMAGLKNVEVEEKIDPKLIGGFVLQMGDQLVDASVAYDLKEVAKQFEKNDFIHSIR